MLSSTSVNIHLCCAEPALLLPEVAADPEDKNHRQGQHILEPSLDGVECTILGAGWCNSAEELFLMSANENHFKKICVYEYAH